MRKQFTLLAALAFTMAGAQEQDKKPGLELQYMDTSVKPGDDFFRYVNGVWFDKTEIPADKTRWGSFDELRQNTDKDALAILKKAISDKSLDPKSDQAKAVNVYLTYMDTNSRNKLGINPIMATLKKIDAIKNVNDLATRARANKLAPDEIQGGTFTLTNVGGFGNVMGTPIIAQPQVAILAVGTIKKKPAVIETPQGDVIAIRHFMFLSLSYDHRVVDGSLGGSFLRRVADYMEQWDMSRVS